MIQSKSSLKLARLLHSIEAGLVSKEHVNILLSVILNTLTLYQVEQVVKIYETVLTVQTARNHTLTGVTKT